MKSLFLGLLNAFLGSSEDLFDADLIHNVLLRPDLLEGELLLLKTLNLEEEEVLRNYSLIHIQLFQRVALLLR